MNQFSVWQLYATTFAPYNVINAYSKLQSLQGDLQQAVTSVAEGTEQNRLRRSTILLISPHSGRWDFGGEFAQAAAFGAEQEHTFRVPDAGGSDQDSTEQ